MINVFYKSEGKINKNNNNKCFKLYGKFRNQNQKVPYQGIKQALKDWSNQILILSEEELSLLKRNTFSALQSNVTTITSVFDELKPFFGKKLLNFAENMDLTEGLQIKSKFYYFLTRFFQSITSSGFNIILFLDDLQWSDHATRMLLKHFFVNNEIPGLIIIGAYRPNELDMIKEIQKNDNDRLIFHSLASLDQDYVKLFIPVKWNLKGNDDLRFQKYLWHESNGNPFRAKQIINAIEKDLLNTGKIEFNADFWNLLPRFDQESNSEKLLQDELQKLPSDQQQVLAYASCIGYYFKKDLLSNIIDLSIKNLNKVLDALVHDNYLVKNDDNYCFDHDHVFSAASLLISKDEKNKLHHKLARIILDGLRRYDHNDLFKAVNHHNLSYENGSLDNIPADSIILNIYAAQLAIKKSAFERAFKYFSFADRFLKSFSSSELAIKDPKLAAAVQQERISYIDLVFTIKYGFAESMFLMQKFEQSLFYINEILKLKVSRHQKLLATYIKVRICSALMYRQDTQHLLLDGIESLESVLADFDIIIPGNPEQQLQEANDNCRQIKLMINRFKNETSFTELLNQDKEYQDLIKVIVNSLTFLYYMNVKKNMFITIKTLLIIIQKGLTPITPVLFSASFLITNFNKDYISLSYLLGNYSLRMIKRAPYKLYSHIVYYVATLNFYAWQYHYKKCIQQLQKAVRWANETGDHPYVSFCATNIRLLNQYRGRNLKKHIISWEKLATQNSHVFFISSSDRDLTAYLIGQKEGFQEGKFIFSEDLIRESSYNMSSRYHLYLALEKLNFLSGNYEEALKAGDVCENLENVYHGFQIEVEHNFYYCLIKLQLAYKNNNFPEIENLIYSKLEELKGLASYGSGNYLHKVYLIEAEIEKCRDNLESARKLYDAAIQEALEQDFIQNAAIAAELAGMYYGQKEWHTVANMYFKDALKYYSRWGADAKVEWLQKKYPVIRRKVLVKPAVSKVDYEVLKSIIQKTSINDQVSLDNIGKYLLNHLVSFSMAGHGTLLIMQQKKWHVLATGKDDINRISGKQLNMIKDELPVKVLNYAINKAAPFTFQNVNSMLLFDNDPYLKDAVVNNIFCYPVKNANEIVGLIYIENFKKNIQNELFSIVFEYAAIALANTIYNSNMRQLNQELQIQEKRRIEAVIESQEKERKRIAEELHDSIGQMLALIKLNLSRLESDVEFKEDSLQLFKQTTGILDDSCDEVRNISHNLMPPDIYGRNLTELIEGLIRKIVNTNEYTCQFQAFGVSGNLSNAIKFTVYRVIQEILHNIIKHAAASKITINLIQTDDGINLMVEDNGKGFDKNLVNMGLGLKNIYSRIDLLKGYFDIDSSLNRGTNYNITIPFNI